MTATIKQYLPFAKIIFEDIHEHYHVIPVTCDNIDCDMKFIYHRSSTCIYNSIQCVVETPKRDLFLANISYSNINTIEQLADSLMKSFNIFREMKFNRSLGKFETTNAIRERCAKELAAGDLLQRRYDCCVCYLMTERQTKCGHALCVFCHDKLVKNKCPICRTRLPVFDGGDDESSDDDEETVVL